MAIFHRMYDWGNRAMWVLALLSIPFFLYASFFMVPASQAISQEQRRADIEVENVSFCAKFGMPAETDQHILCAKDLMDIRAKEDQRTADEVQNTF